MTAGVLWLGVALLLGLAELLIPGTFLIFVAVAAAITGVATLALPELPLAGQLASLAVWTGVTVLVGRRWYRDYPVASSDPMLNDRAARLIGEIVTVDQAIAGGAGRVRVGDGVWPARGSDATIGTKVRVIEVANGVLLVEPLLPAEQTAGHSG